MRTRKVYRIYAGLSLAEREAFGRYLASPYFNLGQRLLDFRQLLEDGLVLQPTQDLSPEEVWSLLPDVRTAYRANGFDKLCAELLAALNDFLSMQEFRSQPAIMAGQQLKAYVNRHFDDWIPSLFESLQERHRPELERDAEGLSAQLTLLREYARYGFRAVRMPDPAMLSNLDAALNHFYLSLKLEFATAVASYNKGFESKLQLPYLDWVRDVVDHFVEDLPVVVRAQALCWMMNQGTETRYYFQLLEFLQANSARLAFEDTDVLYRHALNFCVRQINLENEDFQPELKRLYLLLLDRGVLLVEGKLPVGHFKNIVQLYLRAKEISWVEAFIAEWGSKIADDPQGYALQYNRAVLQFHQGQFADCMKGMEGVMRDYKADLHFGADARVYSLMAIFELNKQEDWTLEFDARLNAFRLYLIRDHRMGEVKKERQMNLIKQFRSLLKLYQMPKPIAPKAIEKAQKKLQDLKPASNRKWFEEQVQGLAQEKGRAD